MNTLTLRVAAAFAALTAAIASAQTKSSARADEPSSSVEPKKEDVVALSPFTISSDRDTGFAAASSLAGGRLALDLKDTPAAYSVVTSEFIQALGLVDLTQAAAWTANVTPVYNGAGGGFSDDIYGSAVAYNVRGAGVGRQSRNFFVYTGPMDSYSVERYDFSRGPNSILFGNGSLGGLSSTMTKVARVGQFFGSAAYTTGTSNKNRTTLDVNVPVGDKFALRAAGVYADSDNWRDRGFDKTRAAFLTSTYQVSKDTSIRLEGEYGETSRNTPFTNISDQFSAWDGTSTYSGALTTLPADAAARGINRNSAFTPIIDPFNGVGAIMNYQNQAITVSGGANAAYPISGYTQGSLPAFNSANANLLYSLNIPANRYDKAIAGSSFRLPSESFSVSKDVSILQIRYMDVQLTADHRIGDLFLQAGIDLNHMTQETHIFEGRGSMQTFIDINRLLPNGATNPHFLQPYNDAAIQKGYTPNKDGVGFRLAAAYIKDAGKWGRYNMSLLAGRTETYDAYTGWALSLAQSADHRVWGTSTADALKVRSYWSDAARPTYLHPTPLRFIDPVNNVEKTITPVWSLVNNRPDSVQQTKTTYDYALAAVNAKYLEGRVVLLGAVRADKFKSLIRQQVLQGDYPLDWDGATRYMKPGAPDDYGSLMYVPKTAAGVATGPAVPADTRPRDGAGNRLSQYAGDRFRDDFNPHAIDETKFTSSIGAVAYATKWLSGFFNYAETFNPSQPIQRFDNTFLPPTVAKGIDYGLRASLFQNRVNVSVSRYSNTEVNNAFGPVIHTYINAILSSNPVGDANPTGINNRGIPLVASVLSDVRDRQAEGYEMEMTFNVTKSWRLIANGGLPKLYEKNSYQDSKKYLATNLAGLKQVVLDAGGLVDGNNVATVDESIPLGNRSSDVNGAVTNWNNLITAQKNFIDGKRIIQNQPNYNLFTDYSFAAGKLKGLRLGAGVQMRGKSIIGNRGADTIVNPANPLTAIDDPRVDAYTPVYATRNAYTGVATIGYTLNLKDRRQAIFDLRVDNLFNQRGPIYGTTVMRPANGDYTSPARESVPNIYALLQPISFQLTTTLKF